MIVSSVVCGCSHWTVTVWSIHNITTLGGFEVKGLRVSGLLQSVMVLIRSSWLSSAHSCLIDWVIGNTYQKDW